MQVIFLLLTIPVSYSTLFGLIGTTQSIGVIGLLKCKGMPASGVKMKLEDAEIIFNRKLQRGQTDTDGTFMLTGSAKEWSKIDPKLNIYHKCNYRGRCYRKVSIYIPQEYITPGKKAVKFYNIGSLELSMKPKGETISCYH